jgi:hypothetical protein
MSARKPVTAALAAAAALIVAGCGSASAQGPPDPATLKPVAGSSVQQVQLTADAMRRIGIKTLAVQAVTGKGAGTAAPREVIPYSAVVYDTDGSTWTYVGTGPRTFVRNRITIAGIEGSAALLSAGPTAGAMVVTVGAPELLGVEYDISGEE